MAIHAPLRTGLVGQLLHGEGARCFWTPSRVIANEAFEALPQVERDAVCAAAQSVSGRTSDIQAKPAEWTFTCIDADGARGVWACRAFVAHMRDPRFRLLPSILQFSDGRMPNIANLHRLMDLMIGADPGLFSRVLLFASKNDQPFIFVHDVGKPGASARSWCRWPVDRLFHKRRAALITNPATGERGLAVPFSVPPSERYLVVLVLARADLSASDRDFVSVLEAVTGWVPLPPSRRLIAHCDRVDASVVPSLPRLLFYGRSALQARVQRIAERQDWSLRRVSSYREAIRALASPTDAIIVDGSGGGDFISILSAIQRAAGAVPVLYFHENADDELEILVDQCLSPHTADNHIVTAIKALVRKLPQLRQEHLEAAVNRITPALFSAASFASLAETIAHQAVTLFGDWAAVHLFDSSGEVHWAETPVADRPIMRVAPMTFLNGYAVMKSRVDEAFFNELSDDARTHERLEQLAACSGAALPLAHAGRIVGTLVILSATHDLEEPHFEAIAHFAQSAAQAFTVMEARGQSVEQYGDAWTRLNAGACDVHVLHPRGRGSFRASPLDGARIGIEAEDSRGGTFSGTLDVRTNELQFEARHFTLPLHVRAAGPALAVSRNVEERVDAVMSLEPPCVVLIYDGALLRIVDYATIVDILQRGVREDAGNPPAVLASCMGDEPFGLIAITFR